MRLSAPILAGCVILSALHISAFAEEPQKKGVRGFLETFGSELQKGMQQRQAAQAQAAEAAQPIQQTEEKARAQAQPVQESWQERAFREDSQKADERERERANRELEERYTRAKNAAFVIVTENAVVDANSIEDACKLLLGDMSITSEQYDALLPRCVSDVSGQTALLREDLLAGRKQPASCKQWALMRDASWQGAKHDMRYSPMAQSNRPIRFSGIVVDGNQSQLLIQKTSSNSGQTDSAYISTSSTSTVFHRENIKVGGRVSGYGVHNSRKGNTLVINAFCLE